MVKKFKLKEPKLKSTQKVLKKPTAKLSSYSAKKFISNLADQQGALVSKEDNLRERYQNPEQDNRSLFFKQEYQREKKKAFGGFI